MNISRKVHILFIMLVFAITFGIFLIFQYLVIPGHVRLMEQRALDTAYYVQKVAPLLSLEEQQALLEKLGKYEQDLAYILILDPEGRALAHNNPQRVGMVFNDSATMKALSRQSGISQKLYLRDMDNSNSPFHGERVLDIIIPYYDQAGHRNGAVNVGLSMQRVDAARNQYYLLVFLVGAFFTFILYLAARRIFVELVKPIQEISLATQELGEGRFQQLSSLDRADEIGDLAREFNLTAGRMTHLVSSLQIREKEMEAYIRSLEQAEQAVMVSEKKFRKQVNYLNALIDNIQEFFWICDLEGRIRFANRRAWEITGYKEDEFLNHYLFEFVPEMYREKLKADVMETLTNGSYKVLEVPAIYRDGSEHLLRVHGSAIIDDGKVIGGMALAEDITIYRLAQESLKKSNDELESRVKARTIELEKINEVLKKQIMERKQVEEDLDRERERLMVTLKSIGDGVISTDLEGRITLVNAAAEMILGKSQAELMQTDFISTLLALEPRFTGLTPSEIVGLSKLNQDLTALSFDMFFTVAGEERSITANQALIHQQEGKPAGMVWAIHDTTDKQKMEQERLKASKLESLGVLAGGIAHDFNNLLTVIVGNLALAKMSLMPENQINELLIEAEKASFQAKGLTHQLLTFARGGAPIRRNTVIKDLIRDAVSFSLSGSNVSSEVDIDEDLWPLYVDRAQMSQVLNNLIINAVQAMPTGGLMKISAHNQELTDEEITPLPAGKYVCIAVKDQGEGVPVDIQSRLFDPYFTTKETGSGLGLATSYSIIRKHDGYINFATAFGKGTTFYVYLPASISGPEQEAEHPAIMVNGRGRILVMDDDERIRELAAHILDSIGYEADSACTGEIAVELYRQSILSGEVYDAVIIDLTIPGGMGGKETIQQILSIDPQARLIVSSGYSNDPIMAEYADWGLRGVIPKPYGIKELSETIAQVVRE